MSTIYRPTDKIKVKIDDIIVTISPLTFHVKGEAKSKLAKGLLNKDYKSAQDAFFLILKNGIKNVEGIKTIDGEDYKLEFEGGLLSDKCIDELINFEGNEKLQNICYSLLTNKPTVFTNLDGQPLEGVELIPTENTEKQSDPN